MDLSLLIKAHSGLAMTVLIVYIMRGVMMLANSTKTNSTLVLSIASIFTLLLLGLGIYIGFTQKLSFADGFILSKIISLLLFIAFGTIALKQGLSKVVASGLWLLGLITFIYASLIATHKIAPLF